MEIRAIARSCDTVTNRTIGPAREQLVAVVLGPATQGLDQVLAAQHHELRSCVGAQQGRIKVALVEARLHMPCRAKLGDC